MIAVVSLPRRAVVTKGRDDDIVESLSAIVPQDVGAVLPFTVPEFKIGTLDGLVQDADDLTRLDLAASSLVSRVNDSLNLVLEGDEAKITRQKTVEDSPADHFLRTFQWDEIRYRSDKSIGELIRVLRKELDVLDGDLRIKLSQYNSIKTVLGTLHKKQSGNLSTKSLSAIVDVAVLVQGSEYLETHLVAVPITARKEFLKSYETAAPMVVPRSSILIAEDDDFVLFGVTTFKKFSAEFIQKCREKKWTPRSYQHVDGGREEEEEELACVAKEEKKIWGELVRLLHIAWSEIIKMWAHVLTLKVFVETVLRYGLPLDYRCAMIETSSKHSTKLKARLDSKYSFLGGNAIHRDSKGRIAKDDPSLASDIAAAGVSQGEIGDYTAYVYYKISLP